MKFTIPTLLQQKHEALHDEMRCATLPGGEVGEAAKTSAQLMHPHFHAEDEAALPSLGLRGRRSRGEITVEMSGALELTARIWVGLPAMREENETLGAAVQRRQEPTEPTEPTERAGRSDDVAFTHPLVQRARTEEEVMGPTVELLGHHVGLMLSQRADQRVSI